MKRVAWDFGYATLLIAAVTLALWLARDTLTVANFSLAYLLAVMIIAIQRGARPQCEPIRRVTIPGWAKCWIPRGVGWPMRP